MGQGIFLFPYTGKRAFGLGQTRPGAVGSTRLNKNTYSHDALRLGTAGGGVAITADRGRGGDQEIGQGSQR